MIIKGCCYFAATFFDMEMGANVLLSGCINNHIYYTDIYKKSICVYIKIKKCYIKYRDIFLKTQNGGYNL